ncbi:MAG: hypothetical protein ACKVJQ_12455 [Alphaproteobacteria bacterium]|jgi:hypothetical protein
MTFGCLHLCVRLALILSNKDDGAWWDRDTALSGDKVGVTLDEAQRLATRGARWATASTELKPLGRWFSAIQDALAEA